MNIVLLFPCKSKLLRWKGIQNCGSQDTPFHPISGGVWGGMGCPSSPHPIFKSEPAHTLLLLHWSFVVPQAQQQQEFYARRIGSLAAAAGPQALCASAVGPGRHGTE